MKITVSKRLGGIQFGKSTEVYKFEKIKRAKAEAIENHPGVPIIDMGVGEPDQPADARIVDVLSTEAGKPENRRYSDNGIPEFQEAAANYLEQVFKVKGLDPQSQILHGIGSKPILAMLPLCLINPDDITLTTVPGYPVIATHTKYLGGRVFPIPLFQQNNFLPDLKAIPRAILKTTKLMYINYPNMPTGQVATRAFYEDLIEFALQHNLIIIQDAAYAALAYDGHEPLSFLSVDGAEEVGVEIHSLSKAFNMTGWRLAFIAGNRKIVSAYATIKDNTDSGQFRAIQKAGIYALKHPELTDTICEKYSRRFDLLVDALSDVGFAVAKPLATFYCYVKCPVATASGMTFSRAEEFSDFLIKNALISTVPWDDAGEYVRFSVTFEADCPEEEASIINEMKERMLKLELIFE